MGKCFRFSCCRLINSILWKLTAIHCLLTTDPPRRTVSLLLCVLCGFFLATFAWNKGSCFTQSPQRFYAKIAKKYAHTSTLPAERQVRSHFDCAQCDSATSSRACLAGRQAESRCHPERSRGRRFGVILSFVIPGEG